MNDESGSLLSFPSQTQKRSSDLRRLVQLILDNLPNSDLIRSKDVIGRIN